MLSGYGHYRLARAGCILAEGDYTNTITDEGKIAMVAASFGGVRLGANWYYGLIGEYVIGEGSAPGTMQDHPAWLEATCGPVTRTPWGSRLLQLRSDESAYEYTTADVDIVMSGAGQVEGIFITSDIVVGSTIGLLWSKANIDIPLVVAGDILSLHYRMSLSNDITTGTSAFAP